MNIVHEREARGHRDGLLDVGRLRRVRHAEQGPPGRVWWPYSVIQIGTDLRLNHVFRLASNRGSDASETFGHFTTCDGGEFGIERVRVVRPRVELEARVRLRDELGELAGRSASGEAPSACRFRAPTSRRSRPAPAGCRP